MNGLLAKILALTLVAACVVLGAVGLLLPIVPGLLFLAVGAVIAARQFPSLDARLRTHPTLGTHLRVADRLRYVGFGEKVRVAGWLCARMLLDGFVLARAAALRMARMFRRR